MAYELKAWEAWETQGTVFSSFELDPAKDFADARAMVRAGTHRWVQKRANVLALVNRDYVLGQWEHYLEEKVIGHFSVVDR